MIRYLTEGLENICKREFESSRVTESSQNKKTIKTKALKEDDKTRMRDFKEKWIVDTYDRFYNLKDYKMVKYMEDRMDEYDVPGEPAAPGENYLSRMSDEIIDKLYDDFYYVVYNDDIYDGAYADPMYGESFIRREKRSLKEAYSEDYAGPGEYDFHYSKTYFSSPGKPEYTQYYIKTYTVDSKEDFDAVVNALNKINRKTVYEFKYACKHIGEFDDKELKESTSNYNNGWDSSRVRDILRYCADNDFDYDKSYKIVLTQMIKEGSTLPEDMNTFDRVFDDVYDEVWDEIDEREDYNESLIEEI